MALPNARGIVRIRAYSSVSLLAFLAFATATTAEAVEYPRQTDSTPTSGYTSADKAKVLTLPAGPLSQSLITLAKEFDVPIVASNRLVRGKKSPPLSGRMSLDEALETALAGTGLTATKAATGGITISKAKAKPDQESGSPSSKGADEDGEIEEISVREEIIVTGTKQGLSIQDTATSVSVYTYEQIRDQVLIDIEDIFLRTANVSTTGNGSLSALSIRGVSLGGVGNAGTGNTANVYVDGSPNSLSANLGVSNLWDIGQVEVLRGPQSTVQGRNALAGAVIVQTADPEYKFNSAFRARVGNENQLQLSGMVTGGIIDDQLAFRVSADYREVDFGVSNVNNQDERTRFQEAIDLRGKLLIEPQGIEGLRVELIGSWSRREFGDFNTVFASAPVVSVTDNVPSLIPGALDQFDIFGGETFGQGGSLRLEDVEVVRGVIDIQYRISDQWTVTWLNTLEDSDRDTFFSGALSLSDDRTFQSEVRANFDYGNLFGWIGAYYFDLKDPNSSDINVPLANFGIPTEPAGGTVSILSASTTSTENIAFFGDVTYELLEKWSLNFGARIDFEEFADTGTVGTATSTPENCIISPAIPLPFAGLPCSLIFPVQNTDPVSASFNAFLPRGSITYNFDELRSLSATVARGYRAGGGYLRNLVNDAGLITGAQSEQFGPEYVTSFEVAFRSLWLDERLRFNANLFYTDWTDQQVQILGPSGFFNDFQILNAGRSELYGLELDFAFRVSAELDLFGSLGLLETKFNDFPFATISPTGDPRFENLAGNSFNSAPDVTGSAGFSYRHATGFFITANASYTGAQFSDIENFDVERADDFILVNARVGYRTDWIEASFFANNLFDNRFITSQNLANVNSDTGQVTAVNDPRFIVNNPILFGGEIRFEF